MTDQERVCRLFDVSRETSARLTLYADALLHWNRSINLVSRRDEPLLWSRHIADALQLGPLIPPDTAAAIDLGSGAGFPGLILAIATDTPFTLIESDARKCAFLREAARITSAPATILVARIEDATLPPAPVITARALANLTDLLALAAPLLAKDGICLFPKGQNAEHELTDAAAQWNMRVDRLPSRIDPQGCILRISEVCRVSHTS